MALESNPQLTHSIKGALNQIATVEAANKAENELNRVRKDWSKNAFDQAMNILRRAKRTPIEGDRYGYLGDGNGFGIRKEVVRINWETDYIPLTGDDALEFRLHASVEVHERSRSSFIMPQRIYIAARESQGKERTLFSLIDMGTFYTANNWLGEPVDYGNMLFAGNLITEVDKSVPSQSNLTIVA